MEGIDRKGVEEVEEGEDGTDPDEVDDEDDEDDEEEKVDLSDLKEVEEEEKTHRTDPKERGEEKDTPPRNTDVESDSEMESASSSADSESESESESESTSTSSQNSTNPQNEPPEEPYVSCIQEAQLSPDGTCIFTSSYNRTFNVYPIDANPSSDDSIQPLKPYASFQAANPIWAFAANPHFNLQDASTTHVLVSQRDSYITLHNALWDVSHPYSASSSTPPPTPINIGTPVSFYKNINPTTEAVTAPLSLAYSHTGTHFFAGLQNNIATYDITYPSSPLHTTPTIPSLRNNRKGGGRGFKGSITALALPQPTSTHPTLLAAGSRTRHLALYDTTSTNIVPTTAFALPGALLPAQRNPHTEKLAHVVMGAGVSSLRWSPCGTYLYVAERASDVLLLYDVRNYAVCLGYCVGRRARTKQKLGFDVWGAGGAGAAAHEVWAGGEDGCVRVWRDVWGKEGPVEPDEVVRVGAGDEPVVGALVHASGGLAVAASGKIEVGGGDDDGVKCARGRKRGGITRPAFREWGRLDILGLS